MERGYCTLEEKSTYDRMYVCYHNLGLNGAMTHAHAEVMDLPISLETIEVKEKSKKEKK